RSREGFRCTKSLHVNLAEGRRAVTKTPKPTGITGERKLEAVSFDDLNFSSSGGEQLRKRFFEFLNHCGGEQFVSAIRRRIIERVCLHLSYSCPHTSKFNCYTDMVSSQMRESLALTAVHSRHIPVGRRPFAESERALSASIIFIGQTMLSS